MPIPTPIRILPYTSIDFANDELGLSLAELRSLSWVEAGVARARATRLGIELAFGGFVGRVGIPGRFSIELAELVPGTVAALAPLSSEGRRWRWSATAGSSVRIDPWEELALRWAELFDAYVRAGVIRRYIRTALKPVRPRGKLNVARTLSLRARGHPDALSCDVRLLTDDTPLNRLALAAGIRAERLLSARPDALYSLQLAMRAFTGVPLEVTPDIRAARADADEATADLIELGAILVNGVSVLPPDTGVPTEPVDVWFDAATVFEAGMRTLVADCCDPGSVRRGRGDGISLFATHPAEALWPADPDIVVESPAGVIVLDAKYRGHGSQVSRDEIYQLMAHAQAYGAKAAALITPRLSPLDASRWLGTDAEHRTYSVIVVDAADPAKAREELARWLTAHAAIQRIRAGRRSRAIA